MIEIVKGNILKAKEDVICHQVNCQGVMGGGLAYQIKNKYPNVFAEYKNFCKSELCLLGSCHLVECPDGKMIANLFGQDNFGSGLQTQYEHLFSSFMNLKNKIQCRHLSLAIPYKIGCGLGGGDWDLVLKIIGNVFEYYQYGIKIYKLEESE